MQYAFESGEQGTAKVPAGQDSLLQAIQLLSTVLL